MEKSRRNFLKIAGVSAVGLGAVPVLDTLATPVKKETHVIKEATHGETHAAPVDSSKIRWAMVIDTRKLSAQVNKKMIEACHSIHNVPVLENPRHEVKWIWEEPYQHAFPTREHEYVDDRIKNLPFVILCNHCENPPCVRVCPTKATFQREDGIVLMDFHRCIGCRFCMAACPYGSRSFNFRDPRPFIAHTDPSYPTRMKGVVEKCNFCAERLAVGKNPACVDASKGALTFGNLNDPQSSVRKLLKSNYTIRRKQGLGTGPSVYYIV